MADSTNFGSLLSRVSLRFIVPSFNKKFKEYDIRNNILIRYNTNICHGMLAVHVFTSSSKNILLSTLHSNSNILSEKNIKWFEITSRKRFHADNENHLFQNIVIESRFIMKIYRENE